VDQLDACAENSLSPLRHELTGLSSSCRNHRSFDNAFRDSACAWTTPTV
jgi:hypothetical protein